MQTSGLGTPSGGTDPRTLIRNPGVQGTQLPQGAQNVQNPQNAQKPQGAQTSPESPDGKQPAAQPPEGAADGAAQAALKNAQTLQNAGATLQEAMQGATRPAAQNPAASGSQGAAEVPTLPSMPELPADKAESSVLDALPRQDGNFQAFLQKLADAPGFAEGLNKLLQAFEPDVSGDPAVSAELDALAKLLPQDEAQTVDFVKSQVSGGSRFTGELFDQLREAYTQSPSKAAKTEILQFLRRFNDYTSSARVERSLVRTLGQLVKATPKETANQLEPLLHELEQHFAAGDRSGALKLLQGKALPFLSDFADHHPDMRLPNTLISILKPMTARYENSSEEGLLQAFRQLAEHTVLRPHLGRLTAPQLLQLVQDSEYAQAKENDRLADQLAETADWAMKGKGGGEPRRIFRQLVSNLLLNKSVYLPLEHAVIPMEWNGKRLVSELWVDPDADQERHMDGGERLLRFLLHMDIPGLGPFDLVLASRGEEVDLQLACPGPVVPFSQLLQKELSRILEDNGLKMKGLQIRKWERPLTLTEAFPRIAQADSGVNMKI